MLFRHRISCALRIFLWTAASLPCVFGMAASPPNIVLVMADDLGWGDTGYNGHPVLKTPHLDAMAEAGLRFNRFYAAAPVCSPTRGSCLTGRHPDRYGVFSANVGHMRSEERTLAELLKEHGYSTGHFGKWHLGTLTKTIVESNRGGPRGAAHFSPPSKHGFDVYFSTEAKVPTWDPMLRPRGNKSNTWWDPVARETDGVPYGTHYWMNGELVADNLRGDDSRVIMDRVIPFIRAAAAQKRPYFAVVWFHTPHLPIVAGPEYTKLYSNESKYSQHYYGSITAMDEQIGRLRRELRELAIAENTLVAFCADNGPEGKAGSAPGSAGPLRGRKRDLFEGGIRVPGLIEWPARIEPRSTTDVPAVTSDYLPTIAAVLGAKPIDERPQDGINLLPLLAGKTQQRPEPIAFEYQGKLALIENRYKIVHVPDKSGRRPEATPGYMLFDIPADPSEAHDLSAEQPEVVRRMAKTLAAWRMSCERSPRGEDY